MFKNSNGTFPFTAYSIQEDSPLDYKSHYQVSGKYYSELVGAYISFVPMNLELSFTTYLANPSDFWKVMAMFALDEACLTRLDVPLIINGVTCSFAVDLTYTTEKGSLAFSIEEYFGVGKIYPVVHSVSVKGAYIALAQNNSSTSGSFTPKLVYPVDDIIFYLKQLEDNALIEERHSPETPTVLTSSPIAGATGVALNSSIVITFNVAMNENSVTSNIDIVPIFGYDSSFDMASKVLTITPRSDLTASTEYSILINTNAKSGDLQNLESEYSLIFTTGTV